MDTADTRRITDVLRGVAILSVVGNHYVNAFLSQAYKGYAFGIVSLFFILSGYGMSFSLGSLSGEHPGRALYGFYMKRFLRILPMYWVIDLWLMPPGGFEPAMLFPLRIMDGVNWFVPYILHCYVGAPLLFLLLSRLGAGAYLTAMMAVAGLLMAARETLDFSFSVYRFVPLGHVVIFGLGLALPEMARRWKRPLRRNSARVLAAAAFLVAVYLTRQRGLAFPNAHLMGFFLLVVAVFVLVVGLLSVRVPAAGSVLVAFGRSSLAIFLTHGYFLRLLERHGVIEHGSVTSVGLTLLVLPAYLLVCSIIERLFALVARYAYRILGPRPA